MSIDAFGSRLVLDTVLPSAQKTPVGTFLAEAENFKKEGDKQALQLSNLTDRVLFLRETQKLYQTITDTINLLSAQGVPYAEIRQRVSTALNLYRGQLNTSFNQFKGREAHFNAVSSSFNPVGARAISTANGGSNDFAPPQVALSDRIKQRKTALSQCLLTSMDPESITGAMPCLQKHSEGLSEGEKKELSAAVPNLVAGKALTELAAVPAVVSEAANTVVKVAAKGLVLGAISEAVLTADPGHYDELMGNARQALDGENPEFNRIMLEMVPEPVKSVGRAAAGVIQQGIDYAAEVDRYTQERFNTLPGIVQAGMIGTVELGTAAAAGPVIRGSLVPVCQRVTAFARCESGSVKLPFSLTELTKRTKDYMGSVELPLSSIELDRLIRNGGFREVPGGKGGHKKFLKETPERDTIIRPSGEVSIGVQHQILKKIARSKALESLQSSPETPIVKPNLKTGFHNHPLPYRLDYSRDYFYAGKEFSGVKEFNGIFSRDLLVVQYHSSAPLGELRTYKWFMPACQGNKLCTIESVMDTVSKLTQYGEITHVSVAKIPAGEPVRLLHGRAVSKLDPDTQIIRPGGGVQYRFFDFDPNWIVATKKLS